MWRAGEKTVHVKPSELMANVATFGAVGAWAFLGWTTRALLKQGFSTNGLGLIGGGQALHGDVIANMLGAFVFGLMSRLEKDVKPWHPYFFVGVTTGFAGSCTTFSSWMLEVGQMLWQPINPDGTHDRGRQWVLGFLLLIGGFHCLYSSLKMGQWCGQAIADRQQTREADKTYAPEVVPGEAKPAPPAPVPMYTLENAIGYWAIIAGVWLGVVIQALRDAAEGQSELIFLELNAGKFGVVLQAGLIFAPLGAWLRFQLSKSNPKWPNFPLFTFIANILGTLISVMMFIATRELGNACVFDTDIETGLCGAKPLFARGLTWVAGISGGFCGCLSTASTFANECDKLARAGTKPSANAPVYAISSLFGAQALLTIILSVYLREG